MSLNQIFKDERLFNKRIFTIKMNFITTNVLVFEASVDSIYSSIAAAHLSAENILFDGGLISREEQTFLAPS